MPPQSRASRDVAHYVRRQVVEMCSRGRSSHVASALSCTDILSVLYSDILQIDPADPESPERDRFFMSKGHAGAALYATLAATGFIREDILRTHYQNGSLLSGHVSHKGIPGVEFSTGSLGHGLPVAVGTALGLFGQGPRVFALLSDGECDEGSNWEAALFASHHGLNNLLIIVDYNKIQSLASVEETLGLEPFADKWSSFGWTVREVDGHSHQELKASLTPDESRPIVVIAHTTKGKGVSFMENSVLWHYRSPQGTEFEAAMAELRSGNTLA